MRFHVKKIPSLTLKDVCSLTNALCPTSCPQSYLFDDVSSLSLAKSSQITWFYNLKYKNFLAKTHAGACFIMDEYAKDLPITTIPLIVKRPYGAFAKVAQAFYDVATPMFDAGISSQAWVSPKAILGKNCCIAPFSVIGDGVELGSDVYVGSHTVVHKHSKIGDHSYLSDHITISHAIIGEHAYIKPGARIGQSGFGFDRDEVGAIDIPQLGYVEIGNHVHIGSNVCIDRGHPGPTKIGDGVRIDNLVQIAHNVEIGDHSILVAQVGIAGSTRLGKFVVAAGQVGIAGHLTIGDHVQIAAQSGIMKDLEDRDIVAGSPSMPITDWHRQTVALKRLLRDRTRGSKNDR